MSKMNALIIEIQEEIEKGELSFRQIADKFEVPFEWVDEAARELTEMYGDEFETDDGYALASAGFGTDEDYGSFGDEW